jgi:cysteine desulfurase
LIYFDSAASYPVLPEALDMLLIQSKTSYANPSSDHALGRSAAKKIDEVREQLAELIGALPSEIVFTSGATESNNLALKSVLSRQLPRGNKKHIVTSAIEHKCIIAICNYLRPCGFDITYLVPNVEGIISAEQVMNSLRSDTALVSIQHVNNELGTVNPIGEIGAACFSKGVLFHSDAAQSLGKVNVDVDEFNVDFMSFSGHKIGGPKGIGALYIRDLRTQPLEPVIHGAGQEYGMRGGTVASPLIASFGAALGLFPRLYDDFKQRGLKQYLLQQLKLKNIPSLLNGNLAAVPHCVSLSFPNTDIRLVVRENEDRLCLAQGSACSSKEIEPSHVLTAIGLNKELADKTLRISFTLDCTKDHIDVLVAALALRTTFAA